MTQPTPMTPERLAEIERDWWCLRLPERERIVRELIAEIRRLRSEVTELTEHRDTYRDRARRLGEHAANLEDEARGLRDRVAALEASLRALVGVESKEPHETK